MDYSETPPSEALEGLIKAFWHLDVRGTGQDQHEIEATPDGSIEIIRREIGTSSWGSVQPQVFAAGLTTRPAKLELRGDARFVAVRLWPWTWHLLGGVSCADFADSWIGLATHPHLDLIADHLDDQPTIENLIFDHAARATKGVTTHAIGTAILQSSSVAEVVSRTGMPERALQRWAKSQIGMPLRTYLRLLRFQSALAEIQISSDTIAAAAASRDYADQAHMARSFRELAGQPPQFARIRATGPFLTQSQELCIEIGD